MRENRDSHPRILPRLIIGCISILFVCIVIAIAIDSFQNFVLIVIVVFVIAVCAGLTWAITHWYDTKD